MELVNFRSKGLFKVIALSFTVLSMSENSAFCQEISLKDNVSCNCRGKKNMSIIQTYGLIKMVLF